MTSAQSAVIETLGRRLKNAHLYKSVGRLIDISPVRLTAHIEGVAIGDICEMSDRATGYNGFARVVSINSGTAILAPLGAIEGLSAGAEVIPTREDFTFPCGEGLLGQMLNGLGRPLEDSLSTSGSGWVRRRISPALINPLARPPIETVFESGVKAIDGLNTLGEGQRIGLFGDPGSGKSTLMGSLARNCNADVCVLAMIGERGREVREFMERQLPPEFRARSVVIASTSDSPAMQRILGGYIATSIAEYFRDQGKSVLLLFDSVTRFARALREVGLAAGEAAVRRGFTPSVYAELPRLIERCGKTDKGSITAIYTVLTENEGLDDPIAEEVRSITDGHIILSSELAHSGRYPAIDVLQSRSRLMNEIVTAEHMKASSKVRMLMSKFLEIELLLQVGEYKQGADPLADEAISKREQIAQFLTQNSHDGAALPETLEQLVACAGSE